jgi:hypothetical protein
MLTVLIALALQVSCARPVSGCGLSACKTILDWMYERNFVNKCPLTLSVNEESQQGRCGRLRKRMDQEMRQRYGFDCTVSTVNTLCMPTTTVILSSVWIRVLWPRESMQVALIPAAASLVIRCLDASLGERRCIELMV